MLLETEECQGVLRSRALMQQKRPVHSQQPIGLELEVLEDAASHVQQCAGACLRVFHKHVMDLLEWQ